ncbi:MAG TPA: hypothetical protein VFO81_15070 [Gaiellaceae bacterium]|nr:hypothetical protein [Gaiellaceae bacterium]
MSLSFLTPAAGLVGLLGVLAVLVLRRVARRSDHLCERLQLPAERRRRTLWESVPLVAIAALLGLAATQPVLSRREAREGREGVEVITIMDITRSMLARRSSTEPTRLERGRTVSKQVRAELADLPFGVASVTDRVLPHLFPSLGVNSFTATIDRAIGIDRPPPDRTSRRATALNALAELGRVHFFGAQTARRIAVVVTDGETVPVSDLGAFRQRLVDGRVSLIFVHVWHEDEAIFENADTVNEAYKPDPTASRSLRRIAGAVDGALFTEGQAREVAAEIRRLAGEGRTVPHGNELRSIALAPHAAAAAFLPLLLLLRRRNF